MIAADIMTKDVITVTPDTRVTDIARLLLEKRISAVPVVQDGKPVGIVSEGDLLRQTGPVKGRRPMWLELIFNRDTLAAEYIHTHGRTARDIMTHIIVTVTPDTSVTEIVQVLESQRIKRVPVVDTDGRIVGIVSRANLLHGLATRAAVPAGSAGDRAIRDAYLAEIQTQDWAPRPDEGNVVVEGGVVHLWGTVRSPEVRKAMILAARNIQGVRDVEDHMTTHDEPQGMNWSNWPEPIGR